MTDRVPPHPPPPPPGLGDTAPATHGPWWKRPWRIGIIALVSLILLVGVGLLRLGGDTPDADPVAGDGQVDASDEEDPQPEAGLDEEADDEAEQEEELYTVPDVVGVHKHAARDELREAGIAAVIEETESDRDSEVGEGNIARMKPTAGEEIRLGTIVRLYEYVSPIDEGEYGSDSQLDALYDQCEDGYNSACLELLEEAEPGSGYFLFGLENYEESQDLEFGDTLAFGDWEMTLVEVETHNSLRNETARGTYIVAIAEFTNNGSTPNRVGTNFLLANLDSELVYDMDSTASLSHHHSTNSDSWHLDDIGPGFSTRMALAFDVPDEGGEWRLGTYTGRGTSEDDLVSEFFRFSLD
jgi:hypothetical protein